MGKENHLEKMLEKCIDKEPSKIIEIEGIGIARLYGKWDTEKLINRLLESEEITG